MATPKPTLAGSIPICTLGGIRVYVHWSWLVVAYVELQFRTRSYENPVWNVVEYLTLFAIVLLHEFGHAIACRQVGGRAEEIVLWPLGGIAFVNPPPRPGALLWSIAAGPLVNLVLVPVTIGAYIFARFQGLEMTNPDVEKFMFAVAVMNLSLFVFNMLPLYPLDGGQILHALLWFILGRARSLMVASIIGVAGAVAFVGLAVYDQSIWFALLALFAGLRCWAGFKQARVLAAMDRAEVHEDAACPACLAHPVMGAYWRCDQCFAPFDTFMHQAECPRCHKAFPETTCLNCHEANPLADWYLPDTQRVPVRD